MRPNILFYQNFDKIFVYIDSCTIEYDQQNPRNFEFNQNFGRTKCSASSFKLWCDFTFIIWHSRNKYTLKFVLHKLFANSTTRWVFPCRKITSKHSKINFSLFYWNHRKFVLILRYLKWFEMKWFCYTIRKKALKKQILIVCVVT